MELDLNKEAELGKIYGYPQCCIDFYIKNCEVLGWYLPFFEKYKGIEEKLKNGFIPCEVHIDYLLKNNLDPEQLIFNRQCSTPYPNGDGALYGQIHQGQAEIFTNGLFSNSIDLTVTSPPYQNLRTYKGFDFNFHILANELYRVTKEGGIVCWNEGDSMENGSETLVPLEHVIYFKKIGFNVHDTMIYQKKNFSHPEKNRYHQVWEYVFILSKGKLKTFNPIKDRKNITAGCVGNLGVNTFTERDGSKSVRKKQITAEFGMRYNIWLGNTRGQEDMCVKLTHPALMPKWLARDLIISWSNPGDIVFDPLAGQGTTLIEAKKLNRQFIGFEIAEEYCEQARQLLK